MNYKRSWLVPIIIMVVNVLAVIVRWTSLPEPMPAHFDLEGNASGTMSRCVLIMYPLIGAVICLASYVMAGIKPKLLIGLVILCSGICLVLLSSAMVSLTYGKVPLFMLAEPVIMLAAVVAFTVCVVKSRKSK